MTREAIETLKENVCALCAYGSQNMDSCDIRGCDNRDAIKTLEQESILDKIKAEFIAKYPKNYIGEPELGGRSCEFSLNEVIKIIDKYRVESEDKE